MITHNILILLIIKAFDRALPSRFPHRFPHPHSRSTRSNPMWWTSNVKRVLKDEEAKLFRACLADVWFEIEMCDDIEE